MDSILERLTTILEERRHADPSTSYVAGLHAKGVNKILEKVGEEATEVLLGHMESSPAAVLEELERRFGTSGLDEKTSRSK
jgi:phosphoribosyl-ATP pyrophosphohydrolase